MLIPSAPGPTSLRYAPFWCEENAWWLAQEPRFAGRRREVVVLANESGTIAMLHQRQAPHGVTGWDYHVVLAVHGEHGTEIWDLDCALGAPLRARDWVRASFEPDRSARIRAAHLPRFRIVDADVFVATLSSDRSHMLDEHGQLRAPAPPWPAIVHGPSNLARLVDVREPFVGEIIDLPALRARWGGSAGARSARRLGRR